MSVSRWERFRPSNRAVWDFVQHQMNKGHWKTTEIRKIGVFARCSALLLSCFLAQHSIRFLFERAVLPSRKITEGKGELLDVAPTAHDIVANPNNVFLWRNPETGEDFGLAGLWAQPGDCLALNVHVACVNIIHHKLSVGIDRSIMTLSPHSVGAPWSTIMSL